MLSALQAILINTYNPDPGLRTEAENNLKLYLNNPDALTNLFFFIGNHDIHRDLRQAAAIVIKNNAKSFFRPDDAPYVISESEKETAKLAVLEVILIETDNSVRNCLAETIRNIAEFEYPERFD